MITERKGDELTAAELNVHCICDVKHRQFWCVGFIGVERQMQINHVVWLAEEMGAEVKMIKGLGFTDEIIDGLMTIMEEPEPDERPGQSVALVPVDWPNQIQRRVLRKLQDATTPGEPFHEKRLAKRLHMPVEEVRHHLRCWPTSGWWMRHDREVLPHHLPGSARMEFLRETTETGRVHQGTERLHARRFAVSDRLPQEAGRAHRRRPR